MRCRAVRRFRRQLGRRGIILSCFGFIWTLIGYGQLVTPQPDQRGLKVLLAVMPLNVWGWCWIVAGVTALLCAWAPPGRDTAGFVSLVLIVMPWMATYLAAWLLGAYPRGWVAAAIWAALVVTILVVAGWPEPARQKRADPPYEC